MSFFRTRIRSSAMLSLLLIISLAGVGLSYTAWTEEVIVQGTAATANFDIDVYDMYTYEPNDPQLNGNCGATVVDGGTTNTINVNVSNVYPGYHCQVGFRIRNLGTLAAAVSLAENGDGGPISLQQDCVGSAWWGTWATIAPSSWSAHCVINVRLAPEEVVSEGQSWNIRYRFVASQ